MPVSSDGAVVTKDGKWIRIEPSTQADKETEAKSEVSGWGKQGHGTKQLARLIRILQGTTLTQGSDECAHLTSVQSSQQRGGHIRKI